MKHLLVVDVELTEENKHICKDDESKCPLWNEEISFCMYNFNNNTKGCPLKPMPQKKSVICNKGVGKKTHYEESKYVIGFNDCIDEILGETE